MNLKSPKIIDFLNEKEYFEKGLYSINQIYFNSKNSTQK
jgi:hypothetical protein